MIYIYDIIRQMFEIHTHIYIYIQFSLYCRYYGREYISGFACRHYRTELDAVQTSNQIMLKLDARDKKQPTIKIFG